MSALDRSPRTRTTVASLAIAAAVGCGGSSRNPPMGTAPPGGTVGSSSGGGTFTEATHAPLPQLTYQGGPLLLAPKIVTVTFAGDPDAPTLEAFDDAVVTSSWWDTVSAGFCDDSGACIGKGSSGGHVELTTAADPSYTDSTDGEVSSLQAFLASQVSQGVLPPPDASTLYVVYVPAASQISVSSAGQPPSTSCVQFAGYHNAMTVQDSSPIAYAVIPECPPQTGSNLSPFESITFAASHEILESATDPVQTKTSLGYYLDLTNQSLLGWNFLGGGEAADLCVDLTGSHQDETTTDGYTVQRIWSNANAAVGLDPCVPAPAGDVYFNVAPTAPNAFLVLDVGDSATFEADAFSSEATTPWTLSGVDWESAQNQVKAPLLSFTFNGQKSVTVNNGDKVQVTVTLDADPGLFGGAAGLLLSTSGPSGAPTAAHIWPILVVTPSEADGGP